MASSTTIQLATVLGEPQILEGLPIMFTDSKEHTWKFSRRHKFTHIGENKILLKARWRMVCAAVIAGSGFTQ